MRRLITILTLATVTSWLGGAVAYSQTKPKLKEISFLKDGQQASRVSYGRVVVELVFDKPMKTTINPSVNYGLDDDYRLTLPLSGQWENNSLWQGAFEVTSNVPSDGDGEYIFEIFGAKDSSGVAMDTTFSLDVKNTTLFICRSGELVASADTLNFGRISAGTVKELPLWLYNESCANLEITSMTVNSPFSVISFTQNVTLAGGDSVQWLVRYAPTTRAKSTGKILVKSSDVAQTTYEIVLNGSAHGPSISLDPPSVINFGKIKLDSSATRIVQVANIAVNDASLNDTLRITSITTTDPQAFLVSLKQLQIAPGDTKNVAIAFVPKENKAYNNHRVDFASNDKTRPLRSLVLNGDANDETPPAPVTNLSATWGAGYSGYTNTDSLRICWINPSDASGIAQIWWKFTQQRVPPQSPADTGKGSYIKLANGVTCAYLPLRGRIAAGRWYCYVWLVDGKGNSGYRTAVETPFFYDITPPGFPIFLSQSIAGTTWFGLGSLFTIKISVPVDPTSKRRDAAEVRWKYGAPPVAASDYRGRTFFTGTKRDTVSFAVPFNSSVPCGDDSLYYWLADSSGNTDSEKYGIARYRFDICPPKITRIKPASKNVAVFGEAFVDTLTITDDAGVDTTSVWMHYRFGGAISEQPAKRLKRIGTSNRYILQISKDGVNRRGIEYRVMASDILRNQAFGPTVTDACSGDSGWYAIRTFIDKNGEYNGEVRVDADGRPVPLVAGSGQNNYQLFSVPLDLDSAGVLKVLSDDLGTYDDKVWRLFDYKTNNPDTSRWLEGSKARSFAPGRSVFIVTRTEDVIIDSGPGKTRRTICPDSVRLYEGWNLIATPFNFPVSREVLSLINSNSTITLRSFERGWNITDVMDPWRGYALYVTRASGVPVTAPIYLLVQPIAAAGRVQKAATLAATLQPGEWLVKIAASAGSSRDNDNWAGVRYASLDGFDDLEMAEPPVIGPYVAVAFPHPEWQQPAQSFSTDLRPTGVKNYTWTFEVTTNEPETPVRLSFATLGDLPTDAEIYLFDEVLGVAQSLKTTPEYVFKSNKEATRKELRIVVGTPQFAEQEAGDIALVPTTFELLQNFPNPFNPGTSIRYNMPQTGTVKLVIYDRLGRRVRTLVDNVTQNAGYHTSLWDGRDDAGRIVASGIYLYKITVGSESRARKMILMK